MPPGPSVPSTEQEEEVAFQVLNQDNLSMSVVGQPLLKPFNLDAQKIKPNLIVHPTRRIINNLEENKQKPFTKSNNNINNNQNDRLFKKNISNSHGNLCHTNSTTQMKLEDLSDQREIENFTKTLDSKLKRLQKEENKQQKKSCSDPPNCRKPFVTTVKKGQFLEPPPEIAYLMGIKLEDQKYVKKNLKEVKKLYAFASHPRVLSRTPPRTAHQTKCEAAAWAAAKLVGTVVGVRHEQHFKTSSFTSYRPYEKKIYKEKVYDSTLDEQVDPNLVSNRLEQAQRRALARKRARHQQISRPKRGAVSSFATSEILRESLLDISQLQKLLIAKEYSDATTQTEESEKIRYDVQLQVHPTDLFDFETEVKPIVEILVSKTIEEALIEILEEEELLAMKEQQRRFMEYMTEKAGDNDLDDINEKLVENMSKVIKHNYTPNLVTSV